jgi:oxygen-independent coproporphyrinogen-3 oxidase
MIGLRTIWGVDLEKLNEKFSDEILEIFKKNSAKIRRRNFNH